MWIRYYLISLFCFSQMSLFAQLAQPEIDFEQADVDMTIDTLMQKIKATARYTLVVRSRTSGFYLDGHNMDISRLRLNNRKVKFKNDGRRITFKKKLKPGRLYELEIEYEVIPAQTVYFVGWGDDHPGNNQIWTQGQGKNTSHWMPSPEDMNDKLVFSLRIGFDPDYRVLANGKLAEVIELEGVKYWSYTMEHPMSSYLLAFAIGDYDREVLRSDSGIPIELYLHPEDREKKSPTYRHTKAIFDFLEKEIGMPYPWQNYKQVPVQDFLYAGMENTGLTIFSDDYLTDSLAFRDKNYVEVNAHELAHQWFGNLVTETESRDHWLHEGFATYYALLAEKEILGEEHFYWKLFDKAQALKKQSDSGKGEALTDPKASSLTFYDKGTWALVALRDPVGDIPFRTGVLNFLQRYRFKNATVDNLLAEIELTSGTNLDPFRAEWLEGVQFPYYEALGYLKRESEDIRSFLELQREVRTSSLPNTHILRKYWKTSGSSQLKARSLSAYFNSLSREFILEAFETGDVDIRQAIAMATTSVPTDLKTQYTSLLNDPSYRTIEQALYLLWVHFPEDRAAYLEQTRGIVGFADRNVELLWLLLASITPDFETREAREGYRDTLVDYTDGKHPFQLRQRAFVLLAEIQGMKDENLKDLVKATTHPQYQFRQFARDLLDKYLEDAKYNGRLRQLVKELKPSDLRYINSKLKTQ